MELIRGLHNLRPRHRGCVATIGAFDGVHHGHRKVLEQLMEKGRELGLPTVVVVFEPLPREYFAPNLAPARLMSFREKFQAFRALGIDRVLRIRFTPTFREMGANEFIKRVFVDGLGVKFLVVGDDLRFGRNRGGDFQVLKLAGERYGYAVEDTTTLLVGQDRVSSTRIRKALEDADFDQAEVLLGRPYSISGRVIVGNQLGRQLNVPTANLQLRRIRSALSGVYAVEIDGAGDTLAYGVANVGTRPTVGDLMEAILEVHIFDFDEDIYGKKIRVIFRKKIRDEKKFSSMDELKENIYRDIKYGREYFGLQTEA